MIGFQQSLKLQLVSFSLTGHVNITGPILKQYLIHVFPWGLSSLGKSLFIKIEILVSSKSSLSFPAKAITCLKLAVVPLEHLLTQACHCHQICVYWTTSPWRRRPSCDWVGLGLWAIDPLLLESAVQEDWRQRTWWAQGLLVGESPACWGHWVVGKGQWKH